MKITVTSTSTSLESLLNTAWYNVNNIKAQIWWNSFSVYIENTVSWASVVYIDYLESASLTLSKPISTNTSFNLEVRDLNKLNFITSTTSAIYIIII